MGKRLWIAAATLLAGGAALTGAPASAQSLSVQIGEPAVVYVAPPPPARVEYAPAPRRGHIWVPGHWEWAGHRHVWVAGHFIATRAGYVYQQPQWIQHGDRWSYRAGGWARGDRDHDGIRNRYDRDRDGDGVPNRYDRAPNNPHRR
jgi:hypothetical protein